MESLGLAPLCIFIDDAPASPHPAQSSAATTRKALRSFPGRAAAAALAAEYKGVLAVLVLPRSTSAYMLADYALPTRHTGGGGDTVGDFAPPALGLSRSFDYDAPKFGYRGEGGLADAAGVRAWIERFLAGSLAPTYQSAPPPAAPHVAGRVRVVVGDTIADEVKLRVLCGVKSWWAQPVSLPSPHTSLFPTLSLRCQPHPHPQARGAFWRGLHGTKGEQVGGGQS